MKTDSSQKAVTIAKILREIRSELAADENLAKQVPFNITARGQNENGRYKSLCNYREPDTGTTLLLRENHERWSYNPQEFWDGPQASSLESLPPQAQIVYRFLHTDRSDV